MSLRDAHKGLTPTGNGTEEQGSGSLRKSAKGGQIARPNGEGLKAVQNAAAKGLNTKQGNIGFVVDATGSRSSQWQDVQDTQQQMFESVMDLGSINLRLVHYGGFEITDTGWNNNPQKVANHMAEVQCCGGITQILDSLQKYIDDDDLQAQSIIVIGDCFEEDMEAVPRIAEQLKERGIRVFTFLDNSRLHQPQAEQAFQTLAERTGGVFAHLGADMPLNDLCKGVAMMSVGGQQALNRLGNNNVRQLLEAKPGT